jgi:XPG I-region
MCKADLVYGVATDDMDALTFGTPKLIRHLMAPGNQQKLTIDEFDVATMREGMQLTQVSNFNAMCRRHIPASLEWLVCITASSLCRLACQACHRQHKPQHCVGSVGGSSSSRSHSESVWMDQSLMPCIPIQDQFIDVCILCGCDYCGTIRGIGPKRALQLILQHGTLEKVLANLDKAKYTIPEPFPIEVRTRASSADQRSRDGHPLPLSQPTPCSRHELQPVPAV